jgi:hypothetical protein
MRLTTHVALLALAAPPVVDRGLALDGLLALPLGDTLAAKRGLLYYLRERGDIWLEHHGETERAIISTVGLQHLQAEFPQLSAHEGQNELSWTLLILKSAPAHDRNFRSLGKLLKHHRAYPVARGVYLYPGAVPAAVATTLQSLYTDSSVALTTVSEWQRGVSRPEIVSFYDLESLAGIYSSISRDIDQLLADISIKNGLIYKDIIKIGSCLARFSAALREDVGLLPWYFPSVPSSQTLYQRIGDVVGLMDDYSAG